MKSDNFNRLYPIPKDWSYKKLSDLFEFIPSYSYSRDDLTTKSDSQIKYIHYGDIHSKFESQIVDVSIEGLPYLKNVPTSNKELSILRNGDVVIADASEDYEGIAECIELKGIQDEKVIGGLHTIVLRAKNQDTAQGYRSYIFNSQIVKRTLRKIATGISVYGISKGNISKLLIPIPPPLDQQKIAEILSTWDEAIQKSEQLVKALELRNKGLAQQLLTGKKRLKGFGGEWHLTKAENIFKNHVDKSHNGALEVLSATQEQGVIPRSMNNIDIKYDEESLTSYKKVEIGDFVISLRSFQGGIEYSNYEGIVSPAYTVLKNNTPISKTFYRIFFKTESFIKRLNTIIYGIRDGKQISYNDFSSLKLPYPKLEEQNAIAEVLETSEAELNMQRKKLEILRDQKKGLMQKLLTGEVRVKI